MSKNGTASVLESALFKDLTTALAGVSPPDALDAPEREPTDTVIATCDEFLRRLYTYHTERACAQEPLRKELRSLEREISAAVGAIQNKALSPPALFKILEEVMSEANKAKVARLEVVERELRPQADYLAWLGSLFWAEAKNRFPSLAIHPSVALRSDWSLVVVAEKEDDAAQGFEGLLARLAGRDGGMFGRRGAAA